MFHLLAYGFHPLQSSFTVNLNELIAHFSTCNITKPHFFTKSHNHWSFHTSWFYYWPMVTGRLNRLYTCPNLLLYLGPYPPHLLPLNTSHHTMVLISFSFLLYIQHALPNSHPTPDLTFLFKTLNLIYHLHNTSNPTLDLVDESVCPSPCHLDRQSLSPQISGTT